MKQQLETIEKKAREALAEVRESAELEALRVKFLGKKGELTAVLKKMGSLSPEERPQMGQLANQIRAHIEQEIETRKTELAAAALDMKLTAEAIDVTMPPKTVPIGHKHPMSIVLDEMKEIFIGMGYDVVDGPEVELESYNFTKLNTPAGHPARDRQDTFYTTEDDSVLLRTQTSPMQIRVMESRKPPIRIISPGRVYRKDEVDATHSPMFHQMEGLVIDKGITMADLKGALTQMVKLLYGEDSVVRFRPHHFPFTEPSCEVDVRCFKCCGEGEIEGHTCSTCHGEGWIEILGAGMVHPWVLEGCGIDPNEYSGFAFGCGVERMTMNRFAINDLRLIFENDTRFLEQF
ncbi:MAG: phenylalanine--tRNA ligase subunit alpha [Oscillospiraceae bacterium]|nr:phenylalanine--tRNA ligase subunit alpha [Oscillospiraceae bacterium]